MTLCLDATTSETDGGDGGGGGGSGGGGGGEPVEGTGSTYI